MADDKKTSAGATSFNSEASIRYLALEPTSEKGLPGVKGTFTASFFGQTFWRIDDRSVDRFVIEKAVLDRLVAEKKLQVVKPDKK